MRLKFLVALLAVCALLAFLILALWFSNNGFVVQAGEQPLTIGAVLPLTGVSSVYGQYPKEGIELALDEINSSGGINGKKLEIAFEDSASQAAIAATALQKLIAEQNIPLVLVGASSPETLAQAPIAESRKVVLLAAGSAAPSIRDSGDFIFRLKISVDKEMLELMRMTYSDLNARKVYVLYVQNDYGEGINKFSQEYFKGLGGMIVGSESFKIEENDFRTYLTKVKAANPDVVVLGGWGSSTGWVLKQARELGISQTFMAPTGAITPEIFQIAGTASNGLITVLEFDVDSKRKETVEFKKSFNQKYGRDPELFSAMGFDAVKITALALKECGENSACIRDFFYGLRGFEGVSGKFSIDGRGDVIKPMQLRKIQDGKFVKLG